ncbi:hypothetical protein ACP4OV_004365 [Aristida adscensionis]
MASNGIPASFNPWTVLDSDDPGDVVGKAKPKANEDADAANKPAWKSNKAMNASTPAKKKKNKKKKPAAGSSGDHPAANDAGPGAGKQNGAAKADKNGASGGGGKNQGAK